MRLQHLIIVRLENLLLLLAGIGLYWHLQYSWLTFCYLILLPDVAMVAYLFSKKAGALFYNLTHNFVLPLILLAFYPHYTAVLLVVIAWVIHISFDRALGYGLKSPQGFKITHLAAESSTSIKAVNGVHPDKSLAG